MNQHTSHEISPHHDHNTLKGKSKKLRFKRKSYGRGWTPASRQGRLTLTIYIALIILRVTKYSKMATGDQQQRAGTILEKDAGGNLLVALTPIALLTCILIIICYKTGETLKRQRGKKKS